ncbi:Hypothetical predicted protein [Lecanosticta acicola]|uniref:DUF7907 domain-containing protein n=1 Tax=Lecanosticta acicola TaxID=111012 RepID=A0AAI8YTZ3_9PEZI|nr:Hypothetical predicted protein [Lecanosticta acicola]
MKSFIATSAALLSATGALAQTYQQSAPFELIVQQPPNGKYNNQGLAACHEGAAIEALCVGYGSDQYQLNTTSGQTVAPDAGTPGTLTYALPAQNANGPINVSEAMSFYYDPSTNVALPLFEPSYTNVHVAFDRQARMNIQSSVDDTVTPPKYTQPRALYRWFVCETYYSGYTYTALTWALGNAKPENPSCQSVNVVRKFV